MQDISGYGTRVNITADRTFPSGFDVTQFADDADAVENAAIKIGDTKMSLNGTLVTWTTAVAIGLALAVIPQSDDDDNLAILLEANRAGAGKRPVKDVVFATVIYPDGRAKQFGPGRITEGPNTDSVSSAGRMKSKTYTFMFENVSGSN